MGRRSRKPKPAIDEAGNLFEIDYEPSAESEPDKVTHVESIPHSKAGEIRLDSGADPGNFIESQYFGSVPDENDSGIGAEVKGSDLKADNVFEAQYFQSGRVDHAEKAQFDYLEGKDSGLLKKREQEPEKSAKKKKRYHAFRGRVVSQPWDLRALQRGEAGKVPNPALVDPDAFRVDPLTSANKIESDVTRSPLAGKSVRDVEKGLGMFDEQAFMKAQEEAQLDDARTDPLSLVDDVWKEQNRTLAATEFPIEKEAEPKVLHPHWEQRVRDEQQEKEIERIRAIDKDGSLLSLHDIWRHLPDLTRAPKFHVVHMLKQRVIYRDDHLLAINKPYGLYSMGGRRAYPNVLDLLKPLRKALAPDATHFRLMHRLDKITTGVMLFALTEEKIAELKRLFLEKRILKKYTCMTRGVPEMTEGTVDMPLAETRVGRRFKMAPTKIFNSDSIKHFQAITDYRVLSQGGGGGNQMALIECSTYTGRKHQIRAHLGVCLQTPILGDDKYTELFSFKPQRLKRGTLEMLGIRSSRSRDLPTFLHAQEVQIPNFNTGANTIIRAPLPRFFVETARKLRLIMPK